MISGLEAEIDSRKPHASDQSSFPSVNICKSLSKYINRFTSLQLKSREIKVIHESTV